jgi:hypothetical protein
VKLDVIDAKLQGVDTLCLNKAREEQLARNDAQRDYFEVAPSGMSTEEYRQRVGGLLGIDNCSLRMLTAVQWRTAAEKERTAAKLADEILNADPDADPFASE